MADLAVLGQDPGFGGGAVRQMEAFLDASRALGRSPELLFEPHPVLRGSRFHLRRLEPLRQRAAARRLAPALREAGDVWVVATLATHGGAAVRSGRPYACWIGTSLDDEWQGRAPGLGPGRQLALRLSAPPLRRLERETLRGAERVYATSEASRCAVAAAAGLPSERIGILPLPVDLDAFAPAPDEEWLAALERPTLVFVGRADDPRKNVGLLLDAFALVRRRLPAARLRLVGRSPAGRVGDGVELVPAPATVSEHVRTASLFVLPSRQEGFGIVAAEALAAGVPVLATPSGGPQELLERSGGGRVLAGFGAEELAEAALELLDDVGTLSAMRARGRAYVVREHSPARLQELLGAALADLEHDG